MPAPDPASAHGQGRARTNGTESKTSAKVGGQPQRMRDEATDGPHAGASIASRNALEHDGSSRDEDVNAHDLRTAQGGGGGSGPGGTPAEVERTGSIFFPSSASTSSGLRPPYSGYYEPFDTLVSSPVMSPTLSPSSPSKNGEGNSRKPTVEFEHAVPSTTHLSGTSHSPTRSPKLRLPKKLLPRRKGSRDTSTGGGGRRSSSSMDRPRQSIDSLLRGNSRTSTGAISPLSIPGSSPASPATPVSLSSFASAPTSPILQHVDERLEEEKMERGAAKGKGEEDERLTPQDRHYINRMLVNLQLQHEWSLLSHIGTLAKYPSPPFLPYANGPHSRPAPPPAPVRTASGLSRLFGGGAGGEAKKSLEEKERDWEFRGYVWAKDKVEESPVNSFLFWRFVYNAPALRLAKPTYWTEQIQPFIDSFAERDLSSTVERGEITKRRMLALGIVRVLGTYVSNSLKPLGVSSPARPSSSMMKRIDLLVPGSMESTWRAMYGHEPAGYAAWVAVVEEKEEKGETSFRIITRSLVDSKKPTHCSLRSWSSLVDLDSSLSTLDADDRLSLPSLPSRPTSLLDASNPAPRFAVQTYLRLLLIALSAPTSSLAGTPILLQAQQMVESYLLGGSQSGELSQKDVDTWVKKAEDEERKDDQRHQEWVGVGKRVKKLRTTWVRYRQALINSDEIDRSLEQAKKVPLVANLPEAYRDAEEWARIWFAYALHYIFVDARTGPEVFNILRSFHELIPYGPIKVGLNLVNPTIAIKAIVHLVLGQPAGQHSLFQRIWAHVCHAANKHQQRLIDTFRAKVGNEALCNALQKHVEAPYLERQKTKAEAINRNEDIVLTITRERCTPAEFAIVERWHTDFAADAALPSFDNKATTEGARKFADLKEVLAAYYRHRDRMQVLGIVFEPHTPKLLHETIATFYDTIHKMANASNLSARVTDVQAFLNDLVQTVETGKSEPHQFIALIDRHHQKMWYFVHEILDNNPRLLDELVKYCKSGLAFLGSGVPAASSSSSAEKRAGTDIEALLSSLPAEEQKKVLSESRDFATWTKYQKVQKDIQMRCDLLKAGSSSSSSSSTSPSTHLDPPKLWQLFLSTSSPPSLASSLRAAALAQDKDELRTGPGGDLEWAWWAADELRGAAGKGTVKAHMESAKEGLAGGEEDRAEVVVKDGGGKGGKEGKGKKGKKEKKPRRASSSSFSSTTAGAASPIPRVDAVKLSELPPALEEDDAREHEEEEEKPQYAVPTPVTDRTKKSLLGGYLKQVRGALEEARARGVK
ncbi:hypothetical protein JCM11251_001743 [Rhodosporidiobolus azoricus]